MSQRSQRTRNRILKRREQTIKNRLKRKNFEDQPQPILSGSNIHYEMGEKTQAMNYGGIGAIHKMVQKIGLEDELNEMLELLKVHLPYHESDHVLNIAYNVLLGGKRLEDIELRRNDEVYLDASGAQRIPDPTTAGDFTRRFDEPSIIKLMECINRVRQKVWLQSPWALSGELYIDIDGTLAPTLGECKQGMDISYNGIWGYAPLIITLANTKEVLYVVNRSGNAPSHQGAASWIDRAIDLVGPVGNRICLRGDTDFSLTVHFDRWAEQVDFVFGMDACRGLIARAEALEEAYWRPLERQPSYDVRTTERDKPENIKEQLVRQREYKTIRLTSEEVAEYEYRPSKCKRPYRLVVVRKNLSIEKGELVLFDEMRYFFYITTRTDLTAEQVVDLANGRCDQENVVEQLKNGVNAMRLPVQDLLSNWAYMVMAALAWNLKAWFGLLMPNRVRARQILKMEFRRFLQTLILIPCQIIRTGRKIIYRLLGYNDWLKDFFATWDRIRRLQFT